MKKFALFTLVSVILPLVVAVSTVYLVHYRLEKSEIQVEENTFLNKYYTYSKGEAEAVLWFKTNNVVLLLGNRYIDSKVGTYKVIDDIILVDWGGKEGYMFYSILDDGIRLRTPIDYEIFVYKGSMTEDKEGEIILK